MTEGGEGQGAGRVRRRVIVRGRVQGVYFRETCRQRAVAAGVSGWVVNRPDQSVEAVFEGELSAVEELVGFCRSGPIRARVDAVEEFPEAPRGEEGFVVRRWPLS